MATKQMAETYAAKVIEGIIRILFPVPTKMPWKEKVDRVIGADPDGLKDLLARSGAFDGAVAKESVLTARYISWVARNAAKAAAIAQADGKVRELLMAKPDISYAKWLFASKVRSVVIPYSALERYGESGLKAMAKSFGIEAQAEILYDSHEPRVLNDTLNQTNELGDGGYLIPEMPTVLWRLS